MSTARIVGLAVFVRSGVVAPGFLAWACTGLGLVGSLVGTTVVFGGGNRLTALFRVSTVIGGVGAITVGAFLWLSFSVPVCWGANRSKTSKGRIPGARRTPFVSVEAVSANR